MTTDDTLAAIDRTLDGRCAGPDCREPLRDSAPSGWWCSEGCQVRWQAGNADQVHYVPARHHQRTSPPAAPATTRSDDLYQLQMVYAALAGWSDGPAHAAGHPLLAYRRCCQQCGRRVTPPPGPLVACRRCHAPMPHLTWTISHVPDPDARYRYQLHLDDDRHWVTATVDLTPNVETHHQTANDWYADVLWRHLERILDELAGDDDTREPEGDHGYTLAYDTDAEPLLARITWSPAPAAPPTEPDGGRIWTAVMRYLRGFRTNIAATEASPTEEQMRQAALDHVRSRNTGPARRPRAPRRIDPR